MSAVPGSRGSGISPGDTPPVSIETPPSRALYILYSHYPSDPRLRRQAEALRDAGWEVIVLCLGVPGEPATYELDGVCVVTHQRKRYRGKSVSRYLFEYLHFFAWAMRESYRRRRDFRFVHVHAPPDFLAFASLPVKWAGTPVLLDIHDPTPELFAERFGIPRGNAIRISRIVERLSASAADYILTSTEPMRRILVERGLPSNRVSVLLNLPEERIFWRDVIPAPPQRPVLAYHGTLVPRYGPQVLLEAAALLAPAYPDLTVRIIGDGDQKPELLARAALPDLAGKVTFSPERVPVNRIPVALGRVTAGVVANRAEGFTSVILPTKLLEYLALGIPPVVVRTKTIDYYFPPGELLTLERPEPRLLVEALRPLLANPELGYDLVSRGRGFFERYAWNREREVYVKLVRTLVEQGTCRSPDGGITPKKT